MSEFPSSFLEPWKHILKVHRGEQLDDFPNYHIANADSLTTTCRLRSLRVGSGESIFRAALLPALLSAKHEVILVTCFWAQSSTLKALGAALEELAASRASSDRQDPSETLTVRICFSSRSALQKLLHPWSRDGYAYRSSEWHKLGLPDEPTLRAGGIDLRVKSLFFLPFSVMHPKFLIVDRQRAWMPSCNVSWETWFEGCVEFDGDAVSGLLRFYDAVWAKGESKKSLSSEPGDDREGQGSHQLTTIPDRSPLGVFADRPSDPESAAQAYTFDGATQYSTVILPSSHHRNPKIHLLPFTKRSPTPTTPLNAALLTLFSNAQREIHILTPNLTCRAVVEALLDALKRGIRVTVWTSKNMMLLEQLVTAGTTTEWTIKSFIRKYERLRSDFDRRRMAGMTRQQSVVETEANAVPPGPLEIMYYHSRAERMAARNSDEPVFSHFKMTLVDREYLVLGSGNMDRASWYTSQELGILLHVPNFEHDIWSAVLETRLQRRFGDHLRT